MPASDYSSHQQRSDHARGPRSSFLDPLPNPATDRSQCSCQRPATGVPVRAPPFASAPATVSKFSRGRRGGPVENILQRPSAADPHACADTAVSRVQAPSPYFLSRKHFLDPAASPPSGLASSPRPPKMGRGSRITCRSARGQSRSGLCPKTRIRCRFWKRNHVAAFFRPKSPARFVRLETVPRFASDFCIGSLGRRKVGTSASRQSRA